AFHWAASPRSRKSPSRSSAPPAGRASRNRKRAGRRCQTAWPNLAARTGDIKKAPGAVSPHHRHALSCRETGRRFMAVQIEQFLCRSDNFGILMHDPQSGETAIVDAPEERAILDAAARRGWTPTVLFTTHHHTDHVEANLALKQCFGLRIVGPEAEASKIPG